MNFKRKLACRIARFLHFYTTAHDNIVENKIASLRAQGMKIGERVVIYDSYLDGLYPELISIGNDVTITNAAILVHDNSAVLFAQRRSVAPVRIGNRVFIGYGAIILPGVIVGDNCIIAAGAVVTRNVPEGSVFGGCPARLLKSMDQYRADLENRDDLIDFPLPSNDTSESDFELKRLVLAKFARSTE